MKTLFIGILIMFFAVLGLLEFLLRIFASLLSLGLMFMVYETDFFELMCWRRCSELITKL